MYRTHLSPEKFKWLMKAIRTPSYFLKCFGKCVPFPFILPSMLNFSLLELCSHYGIMYVVHTLNSQWCGFIVLGTCAVRCILLKHANKWKYVARTLHFLMKWCYFDTCILVTLAEICDSLECYCDDALFHTLLVFNLLLMKLWEYLVDCGWNGARKGAVCDC